MESRAKEVKTIDELRTLVKADLTTPRLTNTITKDSKDFSALSTKRIDDFDKLASAAIDEGKMKIFVQFRESEFPRTKLGETKTAKMEARFPLPGEAGEDPSRYGVTPAGHAIRKAQFRCNLPSSLSDERVNFIINESVATILNTWGMEKFIRGSVDAQLPFEVILLTQKKELYDISQPINKLIEQLIHSKKQEAKLNENTKPNESKIKQENTQAYENELKELKNDLINTEKGIKARAGIKGQEEVYDMLVNSRKELQLKIQNLEEKLNPQLPNTNQTPINVKEKELEKLTNDLKELDLRLKSPKFFNQSLVQERLTIKRKIKELEEKPELQESKIQTQRS